MGRLTRYAAYSLVHLLVLAFVILAGVESAVAWILLPGAMAAYWLFHVRPRLASD